MPRGLSCVKACLLIHPAPPILVSGPAGQGLRIPMTIPMDASLVGQSVHAQGGCVSTVPCIFIGVGLATRIQ